MNKRHSIIVLFCIATLLFGINVYLLRNDAENKTKNQKSIRQYAATAVEACADAPYRPFCYENEIPKLLNEISTPEVFGVIREVRAADSGYVFCHVLAHKLGEYEVAKDPENWLAVLADSPGDGLCSNGYAHGAIMARFNVASFDETEMAAALPDIKRVCLPRTGYNPTELQMAMCYHGIGHVFVQLTEADVPRALAACREVTNEGLGTQYYTQCVEGVYMQLFQPLEPEDTALIDKLPYAPTRNNITNFCQEHSSSSEEFATCWREAWPLFGEEMKTAAGISEYCGALEETSGREQCLVSAYTINGRHHLEDPETMAKICNDFTDPNAVGDCFARGANAFLEEDPNLIEAGVDFCSRAQTSLAQGACYAYLADTGTFNFHSGSEYHQRLCQALPAPYKNSCGG